MEKGSKSRTGWQPVSRSVTPQAPPQERIILPPQVWGRFAALGDPNAGGIETIPFLQSTQPPAESNRRIAKDGKSGASMVFSERCRHACLSRDEALRFAWSTPDGMHMTVEAETKESKAEVARQNEQPECQAVFAGCVGQMPYSELKQRLMDVSHISESTAKRRIKQWLAIGLIKPGSAACYLRT